MFSKTCEYGIRAMIFVAQKSKEGSRISLKDIAKGTGAPEHFIAKIMQELSRKKMVHSIKGPNGGFHMEPVDMQISLADIITTLDGKGIYNDCIMGLKACNEKTPCPMHQQYKELKKGIIQMIEENTIGDFNRKLDSGKYFLVN